MFARPAPAQLRAGAPRPAAASARAGAGRPAWLSFWVDNPIAGAGAAAGLFALSLGLLVAVAGDPHAGAPRVRERLNEPGRLSEAALRGQITPLPAAAGADPLAAQIAPGVAGGEAVITLPEGGRVAGMLPGAPGVPLADVRPLGPPLPPAPIAGLTAPGPGGLLPIIARDGRTPFSAYARPFTATGKPRIALVVGGLGLNATATRAAITRLPPEVTLSFVPYADGLQGWIDQARAAGHEAVLEAPMEPVDYPNNDPGPMTLMARATPAETTRRLEQILSRATGYFAITNYLGGRFLQSDPAMATLLSALRGRGLGFVDDGSAGRRPGGGAPRASADTVIDQDLSSEAIDRQLAALEAAALSRGGAVGAGFAYPVTVEEVTRWSAGLAGRGYQLAPVSAMMRR